MRKVLVLGLVVGLVLLGAGPALGQGDEALVAYVTKVADNLMKQETAIFEGSSEVLMDMDLGGATQHIEVTADIDGQYRFAEGDFEAWYTVLDQIFAMTVPGAGQMEFTMTTESLMADATLYERNTSDSPMFASALLGGWQIVDDAAGTPGAGAMGDPTAMMPGIDITKLPYIIGEQTVVTATELEPEIIDGREMRVFGVELDMEAVSEQMSAWMSGLASGEIDSEEAALAADLMPGLFADITMEWTVWIDAEAELPYRSAGSMVGPLTVAQQGMNMVMDLELNFDMTFTEFNTPVTIEAPDLGS